jgi:CspA family cold shock protein
VAHDLGPTARVRVGSFREIGKDRMPDFQGHVKFYDEVKGFGFIGPDDGSDDVYVWHEDVDRPPLSRDERVEFDIENAPKGRKAKTVRRIS